MLVLKMLMLEMFLLYIFLMILCLFLNLKTVYLTKGHIIVTRNLSINFLCKRIFSVDSSFFSFKRYY